MQRLTKVNGYKRTLYDIMQRTNQTTGACNISRDELFSIFENTVGGMNPSPTSFTKYLGHRQIKIGVVFINGKSVRGISTIWQQPATIPSLIKAHLSDMKVSTAKP